VPKSHLDGRSCDFGGRNLLSGNSRVNLTKLADEAGMRFVFDFWSE
jgi:hypothetical protein